MQIFHEAMEPPPRGQSEVDVMNPHVSFSPSFAVTLGDPHAADKTRRLLLTGRSGLQQFDLDDSAPAPQPRTWTDSTGRHRTQAMLLDVTGGLVRLQKSNGETISLPLARLSAQDQGYVRRQTGMMEPAGATSEP